jgi:uncharacterized membrane protein
VTYVFVGSVERAKYPAPGLQKFEGTLPAPFKQGGATVYRVPRDAGGTSGGPTVTERPGG